MKAPVKDPFEHLPEAPDLRGQITIEEIRPVYSGPYSCVYRGKYEKNGETVVVAVKILNKMRGAALETVLRKLKRERRTWGALNHRNILPLYGFVDNEELYRPGALISPWLPKGDAEAFLAEHGQLMEVNKRILLWKDVVSGVKYLHSFDPVLIHGDLKPRNVLIDDSGIAKICDFGLARVFLDEGSTGMTTTSVHTGTERYLARELVIGGDEARPTTASDVHAMGCIGLEFIFLQIPYSKRKNNFRGIIYSDIKAGVLPAERPIDRSSTSRIPWGLLAQCWNVDPVKRPPASLVLKRLDMWLKKPKDDVEIPSYPPGSHKIVLTVIAVDGLRREGFSYPDPFAVITVDAAQTRTTTVVKNTLNPYWNESFELKVMDSSVVTIQVFDRRKSKTQDQGCFGSIDVTISDVLNLKLGGKGDYEMITLDLQKSNESRENPAIRGKIVISLSTNVSTRLSNLGLSRINGSWKTPGGPNLDGFKLVRNTHSAPAMTNRGPGAIDDRSGHGLARRELGKGRSLELSAAATAENTMLQNGGAPSEELGPLPDDWEERFTPEGRPYYFSLTERKTQWLDPRRNPLPPKPGPTGDNLIIQPQPGSQLRPLSSGWEMKPTSTNKIYFVGHNAKGGNEPRLPASLGQTILQYRRDFRRKLIHLRSQPALHIQPGKCEIVIRRSHIFEDSYMEVMRHTPLNLKKRFTVRFEGENGLDHGGLSREYFSLLSHQIFSPSLVHFQHFAQGDDRLQINPTSWVNPEHLKYFKFIGRCLGLAIFHRRFLDADFVTSFYKTIINKSITLVDLESLNADRRLPLTWVLENDTTEVPKDTFTIAEDRLGGLVTIELKPGGSEIPVTERNKREYVAAMVEYQLYTRVKEQYEALMSGLSEIIPQDLISDFDERELALLIGGISEIDVDDWKSHTEYRGYNENEQVIKWFWECVTSWPPERKSRLVQFVTGSPRIPFNGFIELQGSAGPRRFTIEKSGNSQQLPMRNTNFNRIYLPPYQDYASLEQNLALVVEGIGGPPQKQGK